MASRGPFQAEFYDAVIRSLFQTCKSKARDGGTIGKGKQVVCFLLLLLSLLHLK